MKLNRSGFFLENHRGKRLVGEFFVLVCLGQSNSNTAKLFTLLRNRLNVLTTKGG